MSLPPGIPVPIGGIDRELGRLWEQSGDSTTRASLINLAVYSETPGSLPVNSETIRSIAGEHAMRAILVEADPFAEGSSAEAWISMHCYPRGPKGGSVCSEQVSFRLAGEAARSLQSVVFSHLDSDLPLALWWQAPFRTPVEGKLWRWVDRLLFDSRTWEDPAGQFAAVSSIATLAEARTVLCDLNWARSLPVRQALAGLFDAPGALGELPLVRELEITHAPESRTTALLLAGWIADRLGWRGTESAQNDPDPSRGGFTAPSGHPVSLILRESGTKDSPSIACLKLATENACFEVRREEGTDHYVTSVSASGSCDTGLCPTGRSVRAPREETRATLLAELSRGGRHPLYVRAVKAVGSLWG